MSIKLQNKDWAKRKESFLSIQYCDADAAKVSTVNNAKE